MLKAAGGDCGIVSSARTGWTRAAVVRHSTRPYRAQTTQ